MRTSHPEPSFFQKLKALPKIVGSVEIPLTDRAPGMKQAKESARIDLITPRILSENMQGVMIVGEAATFIDATHVHAHADRPGHHMIDAMNYWRINHLSIS